MTKTLFEQKYFSLDFYYKGVLLGIGHDDGVLTICLPFFLIHVKTFMFKSRPKPSKF